MLSDYIFFCLNSACLRFRPSFKWQIYVTFINVINKARGSAIASTISVDSNGSPREARMLPTKVITKVSIYDQLRFLEPYWCIKITETLDAIPIVMPISELITKWRRGFSIVYQTVGRSLPEIQ